MTTKNSDNKKAVYNGILMEYVKKELSLMPITS